MKLQISDARHRPQQHFARSVRPW